MQKSYSKNFCCITRVHTLHLVFLSAISGWTLRRQSNTHTHQHICVCVCSVMYEYFLLSVSLGRWWPKKKNNRIGLSNSLLTLRSSTLVVGTHTHTDTYRHTHVHRLYWRRSIFGALIVLVQLLTAANIDGRPHYKRIIFRDDWFANKTPFCLTAVVWTKLISVFKQTKVRHSIIRGAVSYEVQIVKMVRNILKWVSIRRIATNDIVIGSRPLSLAGEPINYETEKCDKKWLMASISYFSVFIFFCFLFFSSAHYFDIFIALNNVCFLFWLRINSLFTRSKVWTYFIAE